MQIGHITGLLAVPSNIPSAEGVGGVGVGVGGGGRFVDEDAAWESFDGVVAPARRGLLGGWEGDEGGVDEFGRAFPWPPASAC